MNEWSIDWIQVHILGQLLLAMVLGGLIGLDRELADRPAGLRTHILVAGAATLFVSLGDILVDHFNLSVSHDILRTDPIRLIEAVSTGISFLGVGTIIRGTSDGKIHGLTTAASILVAAGIGVSVAISQFILAVGMTLLVLLILRGLHLVEEKMGWNNRDTGET
ncbi:MAG: hypothetical protein NPIRA04_15740 [Nitrospirales bacterium]|nr:MAG: hypothetical protein NPIRA04_15740 [Nitrospirales bacterium]